MALLSGCAAPPAQTPSALLIDGLVIENHTADVLTEVRLVVQPREYVACGYIAPDGQCPATFPLRRYQGNSVQLLWDRGGYSDGTRHFVVPPPAQDPGDTPVDVVIGIGGPRRFSAAMRAS